jgi:hypothetical protein
VDEAGGLTERLARPMPAGLVRDGLTVREELVAAGVEAGALDRGGADGTVETALVGRGVCSTGDVAGLNVATDSIAPATRHTARMLATSGMTLPCAAKGPASRRSRFRRRFARSSRW